MSSIDVNGLSVTFGNQTNKDKWRILFILKGKKKMSFIRPKNEERAKKIYEIIMSNKPRYVEVRRTKPKSIYSETIAIYCPKEFDDSNRIIRVKQDKKWRECER